MRVRLYYIMLILLSFRVAIAHSQESQFEVADVYATQERVDSVSSNGPIVVPTEWNRKMHIKTNVIGLGFAIANVALEVDLGKHWSFALPVNYSAWDYMKPTTKFRTFSMYPEGRFWVSKRNNGFFVGAHFGFAYYNYALNGDYRYQDHDGKTPALGGGLSIGYRLPISKNEKWNVEFAIGAGAYSRKYDRFYNVTDGRLVDTTNKMYWGIDNAAINFSYSFDLKKRK